jgi:DNA-binding CsgD family transcriptional regulator
MWLSAALDSLAAGRGSCLFVVGEPGIGKSRLATEFAAAASRRGVWVLQGRASSTGVTVPYQALSAALLHGLRSRPFSGEGDLRHLRPGLAALLPGFVEGAPVQLSSVLLAETVLRLVASLGGPNGAMIVLEDLHWACGDTLALIDYLADNVTSERLVVLGTARPEGDTLDLIDALDRRGSATVRALAPLRSADVKQMIASCLNAGGRELPSTLVEVIAAGAGGLPFLIEELLAGLVSRGVLVAGEMGFELRGELEIDVPLSFAQSVRERLMKLTPLQRQVLESAAVLGRDFDWRYLVRVRKLSDAEVLESLASGVDLQLLENSGGDRFRFRHALTAEAMLTGMIHPVRARLATEALDVLVPGPDAPVPELLQLVANLAAQAGRHVDASRYLTEDARRALSRGAVATAVATARRARAYASDDLPETMAAAEVLLAGLVQAGDTIRAEELGAWLLTRLSVGDASLERRARVRLSLAKSALAALDLQRARALCEEALALGPPDRRLRAELELARAEVAFAERDPIIAVAGAESVLAQATRSGFEDLACSALVLLGRHRMYVSLELRKAEPYLIESLRRAEAADLPLVRLQVLHQLAFHDLLRGAGRGRIEQGRRLAEELGALALTAEFDHTLATYHTIAYELDAASVALDGALEKARRYRLLELATLAAGLRATIAAMRGQRRDAERQVAETLATVHDLGPLMRAALSGTPLVAAALADDDLPTAVRRVSDIQALLPSDRVLFQPPFFGSFYGLAAVVRAVSGTSELAEGRDWVEFDDIFMHSSFCVARGIVAGRGGDAADAVALLTEGDDGLTQVPWFRALYRRYAAEAALAYGWTDPTPWLREAQEFFEHSGNEPLARACRSLLRLSGVPIPRRHVVVLGGRHDRAELTAREADVLALLAEGLTNKEIAARLYLSYRTVEKHIERILSKTGATNRTALAKITIEHQTWSQGSPSS